VIEETMRWLQRSGEVSAWFVMQALLPGAALFVLLVWLSQRFVREGFADVRQFAFAAAAGTPSGRATVQRNWWSCTCASLAACRCGEAIVSGLRRCCVRLLRLPAVLSPRQG
jgi:hypothetical protein